MLNCHFKKILNGNILYAINFFYITHCSQNVAKIKQINFNETKID